MHLHHEIAFYYKRIVMCIIAVVLSAVCFVLLIVSFLTMLFDKSFCVVNNAILQLLKQGVQVLDTLNTRTKNNDTK